MEKEFWLKRQRESGEMAGAATSAVARLIHLDLAGRYGVEAAASRSRPGLPKTSPAFEAPEIRP